MFRQTHVMFVDNQSFRPSFHPGLPTLRETETGNSPLHSRGSVLQDGTRAPTAFPRQAATPVSTGRPASPCRFTDICNQTGVDRRNGSDFVGNHSQGFQPGQKVVVGSPARQPVRLGDRFRFGDGRTFGLQIDCDVFVCGAKAGVPSQWAMVLRSTPDLSKWTAVP